MIDWKEEEENETVGSEKMNFDVSNSLQDIFKYAEESDSVDEFAGRGRQSIIMEKLLMMFLRLRTKTIDRKDKSK